MSTLTLKMNGQNFTNWKSAMVTASCEAAPRTFSFIATPGNTGSLPIEPGDKCQVLLDGTAVVTGYVDGVVPSCTSESLEVSVTGRGVLQDIIDCSAQFPNGQSIGAVSYTAFVNSILQGYTVEFINKSEAADKQIPTVTYNIGETPWEIIESVSRYVAVLLYDDGQGNLIIDDVAAATTIGSLTMGPGGNVYAAQANNNVQDCYSEIRVWWSVIDTAGDKAGDSNQRAQASDPRIKRKRILDVVCEQSVQNMDFAQRRANWEVNRRYGRSVSVTVSVKGWTNENGDLWEPNTCVYVDLPRLNIFARTLAIVDVRYSKDLQSGTSTELVLMPREALLVEPFQIYVSTDKQAN